MNRHSKSGTRRAHGRGRGGLRRWLVAGAAALLAGPVLALAPPPGGEAPPAGALTFPLVTAGGEANVGGGQSCALLGDGSVWCWGNNSSGQLGDGTAGSPSPAPVAVAGLPPAMDVSAGRNFTCAVDQNNNVWCWGDNTFGELGIGIIGGSVSSPVEVAGIQATQVSAGGGQACALTLAGTVECWGQGNDGQLGDGLTKNSASPVAVKSLTDVTAIAAGGSHSCALTSRGGIFCWGSDAYGQLGNGESGKGENQHSPVSVTGLDAGVEQIAAGTEDTCAILTGGDLKCWGENQDGQLGNGGTSLADSPSQVTGLTSGVSSVSVGQSHTCAIASMPGPTALCWGIQARGVPGNGLFEGPNLTSPTPVFGLSTPPAGGAGGPQQLAAGFVHTCVALTTGNVECWGAGFDGQLGNGNTLDEDIPKAVIGLPAPLPLGAVSAVSEGANTGCALEPNLLASCWGTFVGDGTQNTYDTAQTPSTMPTNLIQVSAAWYGGCALTAGSVLWCWGDDSYGELGNGTSGSPVFSPEQATISSVLSVSTGGQSACALVASGTATGGQGWCWGDNEDGEVGTGNTDSPQSVPVKVSKLSRVTSIVAGLYHTCAILLAGLAQCWGDNSAGELGNNSTSQSTTPVTVSSLTGVVQLALGNDFSCALINDGAVYCWGSNSVGQLGNGAMPTNSPVPVAVSGISATNPAVAIAASAESACAILLGGQVECWGDNTYGELGDGGAQSTSATPVTVSGLTSAGSLSGSPEGYSFCALSTGDDPYCWGSNGGDELGDGTNGGDSLTPVPVSI